MKKKTFKSLGARERFFRYISYLVLLLFSAFFQACLFSRTLNLFGITADVIFALTVAISMFEGGKVGAVYSLIASIFLMIAGETPIYYLFCLFVSSYSVGEISNMRGEKNVLAFIVYLSASMAIKGTITLVFKVLNGVSFFGTVFYLLLPELLSTLLVGIAFYFFAYVIYKLLSRNQRFSRRGDFYI